jgi:hypothetical protein
MTVKIQDPAATVLIRHESDPSDEYSEVTEQSFEEYYSKIGWKKVSAREALKIETKAAQEAVTGVPHPDQPAAAAAGEGGKTEEGSK